MAILHVAVAIFDSIKYNATLLAHPLGLVGVCQQGREWQQFRPCRHCNVGLKVGEGWTFIYKEAKPVKN